MLRFDYERSCKLDENVIYKLSNLMTNQRHNKDYLTKQNFELIDKTDIDILNELQKSKLPVNKEKKLNFLLKERKVLHPLFIKVNEERKVSLLHTFSKINILNIYEIRF